MDDQFLRFWRAENTASSYCIQYDYVFTIAIIGHHAKGYQNHMKNVLVGHLGPVKMQLIWLYWQRVYNIHMYHNETLKYCTGISQMLFMCFIFYVCLCA